MAKLPLEGVRIVDFTIVWAGTFGTMMLGDLGAEIIRVDNIHHPDINTRGQLRVPASALDGPVGAGYPNRDPGERPWERGVTHIYTGRNKYSVTIDVTQPWGKEMLLRLLKVSDIVMENNSGGTFEKLGLSYEVMREANPQIIFISFPGYGNSGPYKYYKGYGANVEAVMGHTNLRGYPDLGPGATFPVYHADAAAGAYAAFVVQAALHYRRRTGQGQFIDMSQGENLIQHLSQAIMDYSMNQRVQGTLGNRDPSRAPQGVYPCQGEDRWVAISVEDDAQFAALCRVMGKPELAQDERFADLIGRHRNHDALDELIAAWTKERRDEEVMHALQKEGIAAGVVMTHADLMSDPQAKERGFFETVPHPEVGAYPLPGPLGKLSKTPLHIRTPAPLLGQHNEYVYKEVIGVSDEEYEQLLAEGKVGTSYPL